MKVVKEAVKEQKAVASLPRRSMRNLVSTGVTPVSHIDVINDAIEIKSSTNGQDLGEKFPPSRVQQSIRRSKFSGELERDMAFPAPQPSARLATATSLNPVTPLRWKSSKRLELEKKKLQEEIKAKEVAKEEKKNSKPAAKEEKREQHSKMTAMPKLEVNAMEVSHKADKDSRFATSASVSGSMVLTQTNGKTRDMKHSPLVTNGGSDEHAKHNEEASPLDAKHGIGRRNGEVSGTDRKSLPGDEPPVITIDFLRARLLAERASSKAAKESVQQLTKKVLELEGRLDQEIQFRKNAEEAAQEAVLKFELLEKTGRQASKDGSKTLESSTSVAEKLWGPHQVSTTDISEPLSPHGKPKSEQQDQVLLSNQGEEKCKVPVQVDGAGPNAIVVTKPGHVTLSIPLDIKDGSEQVTSEIIVTSSSEQEIGDRHGIQSLDKIGLQEIKQDTNPTVRRVISTSCDSTSSANSGPERQERRSTVEDRRHHMWDQITEEMAALAEDKTQEQLVREGLLNWMGQVPSVLQDILPKPSEDKKLVIESSTKTVRLKDGDAPPASLKFDQALKEDTMEDLSLNGASSGDISRIHDNGLKKVASLIERFEAQESNQREWEHRYAKQNSTGKRRSNEGSITRANSNSGTPHLVESQQESHQEHLKDVAPKILSQIEDPRCYSHVTNSSVSSLQCISAESFLTRKENGKVDIQAPEIRIPSSDSDPSTVEEMVARSDEEGITYVETHRTDNSILRDADLGYGRSLVPSFITPPHSTSSGPNVGENEGDIRRRLVDRSEAVLEQSNHHLNPRALEGTYEALVGHSERSNIEREAPRSQTLPGCVNLEDAQTYGTPTNKVDSALQWDASFIGLHLQHEKLASYSQAGNSNEYISPEVPGTYPLRNDERDIYRGRMESVSRSMEGPGGPWRSVSDPEGDEIRPCADILVSNESGTTRRPGHQVPFQVFSPSMTFRKHIYPQVNGGSGRSDYYRAECMGGTTQNFAYPGREFSRDNIQSRPSTKLESSTSNVNEVLKALQLAKLSIQKTGGRRTSISNTCYSTSEHSYSGVEKHNLKTDYGFYSGDEIPNRSPVAIRVWSHQELSRRYSTGSFREAGSPPRLQHSTSSTPFGVMVDEGGKDHEEDHSLAGRSSPVSNARHKFVDKISTGGGVQYFYPN